MGGFFCSQTENNFYHFAWNISSRHTYLSPYTLEVFGRSQKILPGFATILFSHLPELCHRAKLRYQSFQCIAHTGNNVKRCVSRETTQRKHNGKFYEYTQTIRMGLFIEVPSAL